MVKPINRNRLFTLGIIAAMVVGVAVAAIASRVLPVMATPGQTTQCDAAGCHAYPPTQIKVAATVASATVAAGSTFPVSITWFGGSTTINTITGSPYITEVNWPINFTPVTRDNSLFNPTPRVPASSTSASGSTTSTLTAPTTPGTYTVRVYASTFSPWESAYQDITINVFAAPTTSGLTATPNPTNGATSVNLNATVSTSAGSTIAAAEYFTDTVGVNGSGTPMTGTFGTATVPVSATLNASPLTFTNHLIYVHGKDAANNWGPTASMTLSVSSGALGPLTSGITISPNPTNGATSVTLSAVCSSVATSNSTVTAAEYFVDVVGPNGYGTPMTGSFPSTTMPASATVNVAALSVGSHAAYVRSKDAAGNWGPATSGVFDVSSTSTVHIQGPLTSSITVTPNSNGTSVTLSASFSDLTTGNATVSAAEYFVDAAGPNGTGAPMSSSFNSVTVTATANADITALASGNHVAYIHGKDVASNWGPIGSATFSIAAPPATPATAYSSNCASCHGTSGQGASGPAIAGASITTTTALVSSGGPTMPAFGTMTSSDLAGLATYVNGLGQVPTAGSAIYALNCSSCHGATGLGTTKGGAVAGAAGPTVSAIIMTGGPTMPAYATTDISSTSLPGLVTYVTSLGPVPTAGTSIYSLNCAVCHGTTGQGTVKAPAVGGIPAATLTPTVQSGLLPIMPAYNTAAISSTNLATLANYIATLPGPPTSGWAVYSEYCGRCHGTYGTRDSIVGRSASTVTNYVRNGSGSEMPSFSTTQISNAALTNLANYVQAGMIPPNGGTTVPAAPTSLSATPASATQVNLSWVNNATSATGITLQRSTSSTFGTITTFSLASTATTYSDTSVAASTAYYYQVYASNSAGSSGMSNTATVTTPAATGGTSVPAAPSSLTASAASSTQVNLSWVNNATNASSISLQRSTSSTFGTVTTFSLASTATSYTDTSAAASTTYYYQVYASNSAGSSGMSNAATVNTPAGAALVDYATQIQPMLQVCNSSSCHPTAGINLSNYAGVYAARNSLPGMGSSRLTTTQRQSLATWISQGALASAPTVPAAPTSLTAAAASPTQVNLSWVNNATTATGITLQRSTSSTFSTITTFSLASTATTYSDTSVAASTAYYYQVYASNSAGSSGMSNAATVNTPAGAALVDYATQIQPMLQVCNSSSCHPTAGINLSNYAGVYAARNSLPGMGSSRLTTTQRQSLATWISQGALASAPTVPAAPTSLTAAAASPTQVNLSWVNNATTATGITLQRSTSSTFSTITTFSLASTATTYSDTSVAASTAYYYQVYASNSAGSSGMSNAATVNTPAGAALVDYATQIQPMLQVCNSSSCHPTAGINLSNYAGVYAARNSLPGMGSSRLTTTQRQSLATWISQGALASAPTVPAAPTSLTAAAASPTQVNLSWVNNATTATGITLQRSTSSTFSTITTFSLASTATTYSDTSVAASTAYYYQVYASNSAGSSGMSNTATVATPASSGGSGPITSNATASPNPTNGENEVTIRATVSDVSTGGSNIAGAEYFIDTVGASGTGRSMEATDNRFDEQTETVEGDFSPSGLSLGYHTLYIHGKDATGNWGAVSSVVVNITAN